jgi:DNA-binding response OmpR family regulator
MQAAKILVVDDERNILETVGYNLEKAGFRVITATDGEIALQKARQEHPDLMVLDLMLPKMNGLEVCRVLRQEPALKAMPILMLSVQADETDKVVGLELGADDYMTKPFSPRELVARVRALLRRRSPDAEDAAVFELEDMVVDWDRHTVRVAGERVELTSKEFGLLHVLVNAKGRVLSRDTLLDKVWGYERSLEIETRTVDLHVSQLRKKLGAAGKHIITVKNVGYRFILDE